MLHRALFTLITLVCLAGSAAAQGPIFLVRHAERADTAKGGPATMGADPPLSEAGHARAASLASMLRDAGIRAIFVTEYRRTQDTAAPLAKALGLTPVIISSKEQAALVERLRQSREPVLVVGHSNSVPDVMKAIGVTTPVTIADNEYDNLFIVTGAQMLRLRY